MSDPQGALIVQGSPASAKILVVDGSLTVRMVLLEALAASGHAAEACGTLAEARRLMAGHRFDVLVLGMLLPDGSGVDLLQEIRTDPRLSQLLVLLLANHAEAAHRLPAGQDGATVCVGATHDIDTVLAAIHAALRSLTSRAGAAQRILIINDDPGQNHDLATALRQAGYCPQVARTGMEGLRLAAADPPQAAVISARLADMDGATVVQRLRLDVAAGFLPCVFVTEGGQAGDVSDAPGLSAVAFVNGLRDLDAVVATLADLLRLRRPGPLTGVPAGPPEQILLVDDSLTFRNAITDLLSSAGYHVVPAGSGQEALDLLAARPQGIDCILLDRMMPGLSGDETCRKIKVSPHLRDIPLIMITAAEGSEAVLEALGAGADDYVTKACETEVLVARLRAQLRRKQITDENSQIRERLLRTEIDTAEARTAIHLALSRAAQERAETLDAANAELREVDRIKTEFITSVSHEFRTPLTSIRGYIEVLMDEPGAVGIPHRGKMEAIDRNAARLANLVEDLLALAHNASSEARQVLIRVDLVTLIENACSSLLTTSTGAGVTVITSLAGELPVAGHPSRLERVLHNLVSNAVKFSHPGDAVVVTGAVREDRVLIAVRDTGIGIQSADLPHVFTRFYRSDIDGSHTMPGTGLGLAVARETLEQHGGEVSIESRAGGGTTVSVWLPLWQPSDLGPDLTCSPRR